VQSEAPLSMLGEAMLRSKQRDANVPIVVVLPPGSLAQTRSVVERRLGAFAARVHLPLVVTKDYEGSWTQAFGGTGAEATYLLSGEGELVWSHQGRLDIASLTTVLDQHVRAGSRRRSQPLRLAVQAGEPAPEILLDDGRGGGLSRQQLRGRRVVLMFWKFCSRPCLAELRRLQRLYDRGRAHAPLIFAVGDGEGPDRIAEVARDHHLRFTLVSDSDRRIARRYGVNCWPTMVSINDDGLIDAIHAGIAHDRLRVLER
jgi:peroxiredoxin